MTLVAAAHAMLTALAGACGDAKAPCHMQPAVSMSELRCESTEQCPAGLECLPSVGSTTSCSAELLCTAPQRADEAAARQLLVRGFQTRGVQLRRLPQAGSPFAQFAWDPPALATIAACALFGCAPAFVDQHIDNGTQCILREQWFTPVPATLDIRDMRATEAPHLPPVDLRFGCWLYSEGALIGATTLERLSLAEVPGLRALAGVCAPEQNTGSCILEGMTNVHFLGRCVHGRCLLSCATDRDCRAPPPSDADAGPAVPTTAGARCVPDTPGSTAQACVPREGDG